VPQATLAAGVSAHQIRIQPNRHLKLIAVHDYVRRLKETYGSSVHASFLTKVESAGAMRPWVVFDPDNTTTRSQVSDRVGRAFARIQEVVANERNVQVDCIGSRSGVSLTESLTACSQDFDGDRNAAASFLVSACLNGWVSINVQGASMAGAELIARLVKSGMAPSLDSEHLHIIRRIARRRESLAGAYERLYFGRSVRHQRHGALAEAVRRFEATFRCGLPPGLVLITRSPKDWVMWGKADAEKRTDMGAKLYVSFDTRDACVPLLRAVFEAFEASPARAIKMCLSRALDRRPDGIVLYVDTQDLEVGLRQTTELVAQALSGRALRPRRVHFACPVEASPNLWTGSDVRTSVLSWRQWVATALAKSVVGNGAELPMAEPLGLALAAQGINVQSWRPDRALQQRVLASAQKSLAELGPH
jgi:hypothetical protein